MEKERSQWNNEKKNGEKWGKMKKKWGKKREMSGFEENQLFCGNIYRLFTSSRLTARHYMYMGLVAGVSTKQQVIVWAGYTGEMWFC